MKRRSFFGSLAGVVLAPFGLKKSSCGCGFALRPDSYTVTFRDAEKLVEAQDGCVHTFRGVEIVWEPDVPSRHFTEAEAADLVRLLRDRRYRGLIETAELMEEWCWG